MNKGTGSRLRAQLMSCAAVLTLLATAGAGAQEAAREATSAGDGERAVDTIVVTARRREESLIDVPVAMTVQSAEALDLSGATDITALQRNTPKYLLVEPPTEELPRL